MQNPHASPPVTPPIGAASVLVVEDNDTTRNRMSRLLRQRGYTVTEATDGLDALRKVTAARFDAILLDLLLPHVDGWQFRATQLRHPELARIPTVIVTVQPLREPDRYVLRADDIVRKPFEDADILKAVQRACDVPQARAAAREASTTLPRPAPATGTADTVTGNGLFWSRRGEIACAEHAPTADSPRWGDERWAALPAGAGRAHLVPDASIAPVTAARSTAAGVTDPAPASAATSSRVLDRTLRPCGTWRCRFMIGAVGGAWRARAAFLIAR